MLDVRVYRTAFLPALVALFVAAFALADRPTPAVSSLPTDAFDAARAFGSETAPTPETLLGMARDFPSREPGSPGDRALADRVAEVLAAPDELDADAKSAFEVRRTVTRARTASGSTEIVNVIGTRPGLSNRRIVVLASRDAVGGPGLAELSGTAALLELARVFKTRDLEKTLEFVSTSGATTGFAGARAWAKEQEGGPIDGVIVLGDVAGTQVHKPWVVSWPASAGPVPLGLERTVQAAVRAEAKNDPGGPRVLAQWMRRSLGVTVSEQGPIGAEGLPAVLISASGELGPAPGAPVLADRLEVFGRAALRAVTALDETGSRPAAGEAPDGIVTMRNVLPDWAVRLVIGALVLPALLVALDGFFRVRRRRVAVAPAVGGLAITAFPVLIAWLWLRVLGLTGLLASADGPVLPPAFPRETSSLIAIGSAALVAVVVWYGLRRLLARPAPVDGVAIVTGLAVSLLAAVVWGVNPYAAALLLPAAHLWTFAAAGWRRRAAAAAALAGLALPVLAVVGLARALALGPLDFTWATALGVAGGSGLWIAIVAGVLLATLGGMLRVAIARGRAARDEDSGGADFTTRGPLSYAGPGSLGGTESALRR